MSSWKTFKRLSHNYLNSQPGKRSRVNPLGESDNVRAVADTDAHSWLIDHSFDPRCTPYHLYNYGSVTTAILEACLEGNLSICRWLHAKNTLNGIPDDFLVGDRYGRTPMTVACEKGNLRLCQWLQANGANVSEHKGFTPLTGACKGGHLDICRWLHANGAAEHVTLACRDGYTPMIWACAYGHLDICCWLYANGAIEHITLANNFGSTPMMKACAGGHLDICLWLLHAGVHLRIEDFKHHPEEWKMLGRMVSEELSLHRGFVSVVLYGIHRSSGATSLNKLGGISGMQQLLAEFVGVTTGRPLGLLRRAALFFAQVPHINDLE